MFKSNLRWIALTLLVAFSTTSCAIFPLSRKFNRWAAESCGRKNILQRTCSGLVMIVTLPVYLVALVIDLPISIVEFLSGAQWVHDPLIKNHSASLDFNKRYFAGNDNDTWEVQRSAEDPNTFELKKINKDHTSATYRVRILPDQNMELTSYSPVNP